VTRFVIRPDGMMTTPKAIAIGLGAKTRAASWFRTQPRGHRYTPDWNRDFFMAYVPGVGVPEELLHFYTRHKGGQRALIRASGVKVPDDYPADVWVRRPIRHSCGVGFEVIRGEHPEYNPNTHYISPLFPKQWEYRLVYVRGVHTVTLYKRVNEDTPPDVPWNHTHGATFVTTEDWNTCRLRHTSVLADLANNPITNNAHLVAVDVMLRNRRGGIWEYAVAEFNFCPSLSIETNLQKVIENADRQ
jgi:hypothetical protein